MEIFILIFAIVLIINVTCSFSIIFIERKEPSTTWAWLLVLLILPGIGFIFYLLFGQNFSRERLFKEKKEEFLKDFIKMPKSKYYNPIVVLSLVIIEITALYQSFELINNFNNTYKKQLGDLM